MSARLLRRATVRGERTRHMSALLRNNYAILLGLAAITTSSTALGQDAAPSQTPDNAHAFLRVALVGAQTSGNNFTIVRVESSNCLTIVYSTANSEGYSERLQLDWTFIRSAMIHPDYPPTIKLEGSLRPEYLYNGKPSNYYRHPNGGISNSLPPGDAVIVVGTEMAPRVMRAMEVIRKNCDRTKGFAF